MTSTRPAKNRIASRIYCTCLLALLCVLCGCKTNQLVEPVHGSGYDPQNVYRSLGQLPVSIRRIAVLPVTCDTSRSDLDAGRELLEPIIVEELGKTRKFEIITVTPEKLRAMTGRVRWNAEEKLPANLLKTLHDELDCDAVLFSRLTQFRAYPPLAVGFSFKLVEVDRAEFVWVTDEVFDASEPQVVNSARRFHQSRDAMPALLADSRSILNSPGVFGRYAANSVFKTLPGR